MEMFEWTVLVQVLHEDMRKHHEQVMLAVHNGQFLLDSQPERLSDTSRAALRDHTVDLKVRHAFIQGLAGCYHHSSLFEVELSLHVTNIYMPKKKFRFQL